MKHLKNTKDGEYSEIDVKRVFKLLGKEKKFLENAKPVAKDICDKLLNLLKKKELATLTTVEHMKGSFIRIVFTKPATVHSDGRSPSTKKPVVKDKKTLIVSTSFHFFAWDFS